MNLDPQQQVFRNIQLLVHVPNTELGKPEVPEVISALEQVIKFYEAFELTDKQWQQVSAFLRWRL